MVYGTAGLFAVFRRHPLLGGYAEKFQPAMSEDCRQRVRIFANRNSNSG
jgi:hypothetical protein